MSHDDQTTAIKGEVTDIFAHRFVVKTGTGNILADLGPKGAKQVCLKAGDHVELTGEMKPSELKVHSLARGGAQPIAIDHRKKPQHDEHDEADPKPALTTAEANGFTVMGAPRRKPKHFEILGRDGAGDLVELHVELDGTLRKTKPLGAHDPKWPVDLRAAT